jgi:hypothetical protein
MLLHTFVVMERKAIMVDLMTHKLLSDLCRDKNYVLGGYAAKVIRDAVYFEKHGKRPVEKKSKTNKTK